MGQRSPSTMSPNLLSNFHPTFFSNVTLVPSVPYCYYIINRALICLVILRTHMSTLHNFYFPFIQCAYISPLRLLSCSVCITSLCNAYTLLCFMCTQPYTLGTCIHSYTHMHSHTTHTHTHSTFQNHKT